MKGLKFVLAGLLISTTAFAQGEGGEEMPADPSPGGDGMGGDGMGGDMSAGGEGTTDAPPPQLSGFWGKEVVGRSYNVAAGKIAVTGGLTVARLSITDPITMTTVSDTGVGLGLGGHYGVTNEIMAGLLYAFSVKDFEIKGPLTIYGAYQIVHNDKLSVTATADFTYDLNAETKGINAGLGLRYNVAPKVAVFTGAPFGPGPVGQHLSISLDDMGPISFDVLAGAGYQATPELFAYLSTNIAHINISNDATAVFGADFIPLQLGGLYNVNDNLDVTASFTLPDLKEIGFDIFAFSVGGIYRM